MHRFFLPPAEWNAPSPALDPGESHHALDVLRLGEGDCVVVFDGVGTEAIAQISALVDEWDHFPSTACMD